VNRAHLHEASFLFKGWLVNVCNGSNRTVPGLSAEDVLKMTCLCTMGCGPAIPSLLPSSRLLMLSVR
jgi:hypothetical protein